jgi:hypothetical protein
VDNNLFNCCTCGDVAVDIPGSVRCCICHRYICGNCRKEQAIVLTDHTSHVHVEVCEDCYKKLTPDSPEWREK